MMEYTEGMLVQVMTQLTHPMSNYRKAQGCHPCIPRPYAGMSP